MRNKWLSLLFLIAFVSSFSAVAASENAEDAIKSVLAKYQTSFNAGDVDGIVPLYVSDAVLMPADSPAQNGIQAIRAFMEEVFRTWSHELSFNPVEAVVVDEWAFLRLEIKGTVTVKSTASSQTLSNKGLIILLQSENGEWKFARYVFNRNKAP